MGVVLIPGACRFVAMPILIDGYNLLHASGLVPRGQGPSTLERARGALLRFLASSLEAREAETTTIVFDSSRSFLGPRRQENSYGLRVLFASEHDTADELIEALIRSASAPRRLTVVSSDRRIHRAARRRRARAVDSDRWFAEMVARRRQRALPAPPLAKPEDPLSPAEVEYWLAEFGDPNAASPGGEHPGPAGEQDPGQGPLIVP